MSGWFLPRWLMVGGGDNVAETGGYCYTWQVHPPKLPPKATPLERVETREEKTKDGKTRHVERKIPYDPPVYRDGKRLYVLVRDSRDLKSAGALAAELKATVVVK